VKKNDNWRHFDVQDSDAEESATRRWGPIAGAVVLVLVLGGAGAVLIKKMSGQGMPAQPLVQQISIVVPPPPPPPPKLEEPEPEVEELEIEEPEPVAEDTSEPPPGEELGVDADGVAGSDAFGLRAKKGGRGLLGGDPYAWYAGVLQREIQALLAGNESIRGKGDYAVVVSISLSPDGQIGEARLLSGSNSADLDEALRRALSTGLRLTQRPPDDLPQPIRLRISSRS
jgi:hypothetical protein